MQTWTTFNILKISNSSFSQLVSYTLIFCSCNETMQSKYKYRYFPMYIINRNNSISWPSGMSVLYTKKKDVQTRILSHYVNQVKQDHNTVFIQSVCVLLSHPHHLHNTHPLSHPSSPNLKSWIITHFLTHKITNHFFLPSFGFSLAFAFFETILSNMVVVVVVVAAAAPSAFGVSWCIAGMSGDEEWMSLNSNSYLICWILIPLFSGREIWSR